MNQEELAQALADHFNPPHWEEQRKQPPKAYRHLPLEEQYSKVWVAKTPESQPYITEHFTNDEGQRDVSTRAANFLEIAEAVMKVLNPITHYRLVDSQGFPTWSGVSGYTYTSKEKAFKKAEYLSRPKGFSPLFVEARTTFNGLNTEWTRIEG